MSDRILKLYESRKREEINKKINAIVDEEYRELSVVKEYDNLVLQTNEAFAALVEKYNVGSKYEDQPLIKNAYEVELPYELNADLRFNIARKYEPDVKEATEELESLLEEVRAVLSLSDDKDYQIKVLTEYDILDKKGRLTI